MARAMNKLTAVQIRKAKPDNRVQKLFDGGGLYLEVRPDGAKYWRMKYYFSGKERRLAIGVYPDVSLAMARESRDEARKLLADGIDPSEHKRQSRAQAAEASANTFKTVAEDWLERIHRHEVVESHFKRNRRRLELYAYPKLGSRPINDITAPELLAALTAIQERGHIETAHRVKSLCGQIFRYGIGRGVATRDLTGDLRGQLLSPKTRHHPAITDPKELPGLLRAIDGYGGQVTTQAALRLSALLFVRPGELRQARWEDFDLEQGLWSFTASKNSQPLMVPLPHQALATLRELWQLTGRGEYVFPGVRSPRRPMSNATINAALQRMGYKDQMSAHGFRAIARTLLAEQLGYPAEHIEQQLAHQVRDVHGRAYNRTQFLEQRREMLQAWADYLDRMREDQTSAMEPQT